MAIGGEGTSARSLNVVFHLGAAGGLTDGQLLERFAGRSGPGAELAFASLVERHGTLVFRVCRSVLRDEHAAHDAFQATFLVLVDKARSLRVADSLAPWLHAVAYRVALCARGAAARRRRHERASSGGMSTEATGPPDDSKELGALLHEEIEALPERYRVPVVLCDLEGRSHDEAARQLGWPVGTVKSRQARGRDRLRARLERRGVAPAGFAIGARSAPAAKLITETASVAVRVSTRGIGAAPGPVASLAKEVLMGFAIGKLKWAGAWLLGLALATTGALAFGPGGKPGGRPTTRAPATALVADDAPGERTGRVYFGFFDGLTAVDPKTGEAARILLKSKGRPRISPDGRRVAFEWEDAIWVRELDKLDEPRKLLDLEGAAFGTPPVWSPDGSKLIVSLGRRQELPGDQGAWRYKTVRINLDGTGREELKIPDADGVQDWAPGDWLLTASSRGAEVGWELYVMKPDGSEQRQVTKGGNPFYARFAPDGKRLLYSDGTTEERRGVWVVGLDGQGRRKVFAFSGGRQTVSACWSPDGKRIAILDIGTPKSGPSKGRLVIREADGEGQVEFPLDDPKVSDMPDWR